LPAVKDIKTGKDLFILVNDSQMPAFTEFYTAFFQKLLLISDKHVKDIFIAEEIVQDIFLKIWENPAHLDEIKAIKPYLYRAVINSSINHVNRQKNIEIHHQKIAAEFTEEELIELDEENEMVIALHVEINKLPPQCQKIFKLSRFDHYKYKEIADLEGISERTVENHISTALKILRKALLDKKSSSKSPNVDIMMSLFLF
jgi:RNA polymerase sigma-70 factor (family 1)